MGMVIHDDFWAACQAMPEKQRAPFLYALVEYRFAKKEPKGSPAWLPTFIALKQRIDLGDEASERGRRMAAARWGKEAQQESGGDAAAPSQGDAQAHAQAHAQACAAADAQAHAQASKSNDAEVEDEVVVGEPPYSPPMHGIGETAPFWLRCLKAFNDATGSSYTTMPEKCRRTLERSSGAFSAEEVAAMVSYKRAEWAGTRFSRGLTPNTLFSPDHFEQYMHQSLGDAKGAARYAEYN